MYLVRHMRGTASELGLRVKDGRTIFCVQLMRGTASELGLRVKDGRTIFCVQTTQCAVPCKGKQTGLRKNTNSV